MKLPSIAVAYSDFSEADQAFALADKLQLPLVNVNNTAHDFLLLFTESRLELQVQKDDSLAPIFVDFSAGRIAHRLKQGHARDELIAKAVGIKRSENLSVLDVTAGLGRDAFVLACLNAKVTLCERSPIIAALLRNGLDRASQLPEFANVKLKLMVKDAHDYLENLSPTEYPDVVYCDPMYPVRAKSALPKKEMRILRQIVGEDLDAKSLIQTALSHAKRRVVLKRPRKSVALIDRKPDIVYEGQSSRFDVWLIH